MHATIFKASWKILLIFQVLTICLEHSSNEKAARWALHGAAHPATSARGSTDVSCRTWKKATELPKSERNISHLYCKLCCPFLTQSKTFGEQIHLDPFICFPLLFFRFLELLHLQKPRTIPKVNTSPPPKSKRAADIYIPIQNCE